MFRLFPIFFIFCILSCSNSSQRNKEQCWATGEITQDSTKASIGTGTKQTTQETIIKASRGYNIFEYTSEGYPKKRVYAAAKNRNKCFFVISKVHPEHLSVYEAADRDTVLLAVYPVCIARNKGQKERKGDNRTPESYPGKPFSISQIQDASDWHHDFGDGRGSILAYGHWFMRLVTPGFSGIGIHGSTNNRESIITGRGSEGCIRLLDEDLIHLKENYAQVGTQVIILPEDLGPLPFELLAFNRVHSSNNPKPSKEVTAGEMVNSDDEGLNDSRPRAKEKRNKEKKSKDAKTLDKSSKMPPAKQKSFVIVQGSRQQLRTGPTREYPLYKDNDGVSICPDDGERLEFLEEVNGYYKVIFDSKELYINPRSCIKEEQNE